MQTHNIAASNEEVIACGALLYPATASAPTTDAHTWTHNRIFQSFHTYMWTTARLGASAEFFLGSQHERSCHLRLSCATESKVAAAISCRCTTHRSSVLFPRRLPAGDVAPLDVTAVFGQSFNVHASHCPRKEQRSSRVWFWFGAPLLGACVFAGRDAGSLLVYFFKIFKTVCSCFRFRLRGACHLSECVMPSTWKNNSKSRPCANCHHMRRVHGAHPTEAQMRRPASTPRRVKSKLVEDAADADVRPRSYGGRVDDVVGLCWCHSLSTWRCPVNHPFLPSLLSLCVRLPRPNVRQNTNDINSHGKPSGLAARPRSPHQASKQIREKKHQQCLPASRHCTLLLAFAHTCQT